MTPQRIAMLLSGGVDSAVAMRLLVDAGHDVHAFYLKIWLEEELAALGECPWEEDLHFARAVCAQAGVPLAVVPLQQQYHRTVVDAALHELQAGRTPSPDIWCNERVKFGAFWQHLSSPQVDRDFDAVGSGHYARVDRAAGRIRLRKGRDPIKDQTYFLYRLDQQQLGRCHFPLGDLTKAQVRDRARVLNLPNRDRPDSQGICFLGKIRFDDFVGSYLGERPGEIRQRSTDRILGQHRGPWFATIGQRKGLGLGGGPWYVVEKDLSANVVYVAHATELPEHLRRRLVLSDVHWIRGESPLAEHSAPVSLDATVKLRHGPATTPCTVQPGDGGQLSVTLETADPGVAAGQSAVLYDDDTCLGGGVIT